MHESQEEKSARRLIASKRMNLILMILIAIIGSYAIYSLVITLLGI